MASKFDTHVAAEGTNQELHDTLLNFGFQDDGLVGRYVKVVNGVAVSSCPFIGIHMSKKEETAKDSLSDLNKTRELMERYKMVGYGHSEVTLAREMISSDDSLDTSIKPRFLPLQPSSSHINKEWDVHITIPKDSLDERLKEAMQMYGFDWIDLRKTDGRLYRVYSAQGTCSLDTGRKLYACVLDWIRSVNAPSAKCKLEKYVDMYRTGNPEIVPPVVDKVTFRSSSD